MPNVLDSECYVCGKGPVDMISMSRHFRGNRKMTIEVPLCRAHTASTRERARKAQGSLWNAVNLERKNWLQLRQAHRERKLLDQLKPEERERLLSTSGPVRSSGKLNSAGVRKRRKKI